MARHTDEFECPLCEKKLKEGHPLIAEWFRRVRKQFPDCHTSCVFRGEQEQNEAVKRGASRAKWPSSKHNNMRDGRPYALAMDLFQIRGDGVASWNWKFFKAVADFLKAEDAPLEWGGDWLKFKDGPHFQLKRGPEVYGPTQQD